MRKTKTKFCTQLLCGAAIYSLASVAMAHAETAQFSIPPQPLDQALSAFGQQSGHSMMVNKALTASKKSPGVMTAADPETALTKLLAGTGLSYRRNGEVFVIVADVAPVKRLASAPIATIAAAETVSGSAVEGLVVTAQKRRENIQDVPIAISAFTQDQLTLSQIAGGPDLMTQVPNMTFTKTNFSGYSIQIRGIGTQAISATTDPAVAVAFNNTPFVRNRFFEQEFYDVERIEVLRGPQGTLYGRNATAGVVNLISAKPSFVHEAKGAIDLGNFNSRRLEGMLNIPLAEDKAALRLAAAWTDRDGYAMNEITGNPIDGRDLWSTRLSLRLEPTEKITANLIWEHFEEDDDRLRSGKQLCKKDLRTQIGDLPIPPFGSTQGLGNDPASVLSQGCVAASLYADESFQTPNGYSLPYYHPVGVLGVPVVPGLDPYLSTVQSTDLRVIESAIDPKYRAKSDLAQLQVEFEIADGLTLTSETAYSADVVFSMQDFNRFNTAPGAFSQAAFDNRLPENRRSGVLTNGVFCDPQLGCSDRLVAADLSTADSRQFSQEFRLSSNYDGPFNFSVGANFLRYDTEDKFYVFINTLSLLSAAGVASIVGGIAPADMPFYVAGVSDNHECLNSDITKGGFLEGDPFRVQDIVPCTYMDPNPIGSLNDLGHNYFLSRNPYKLVSYAAFGEAYYNLTSNLKLTAGLRFTVDRKEAPRIPSWLLAANTVGYPVAEVVKQEWKEPTGRLAIDWKPDLAFTDDTLLYASYARGYKAGGANPPPTTIITFGGADAFEGSGQVLLDTSLTNPKTFDAEYVDAFEIGTKNTFWEGRLTANLNGFYYDYRGYQISQIVDRSASNMNFDAEVWGSELEVDWRPLENLRFGLKVGYENTRVADGEKAIDIMDRTAGNPDWVTVRPFPTIPSNCILPVSVLTYGGQINLSNGMAISIPDDGPCVRAYVLGVDPITYRPYTPNPTLYNLSVRFGPTAENLARFAGYPGFNPAMPEINNGQGFFKDLSGNELPNAPHYTATFTTDYTLPLPADWLVTLHTDLYYQSEAWTRIFNMDGYDKLKAYYNVNFAAIFSNEDAGWNVMAYVKNVLDRDSITGAFLNSDDTGLTTNVFLTEPRIYGVRITKKWMGSSTPSPWFGGGKPHDPNEPYPFTLELGGGVSRFDADNEVYAPAWVDTFRPSAGFPLYPQQDELDWGDQREVKLIYAPDGRDGLRLSGALRYSDTNGVSRADASSQDADICFELPSPPFPPDQTSCVDGPFTWGSTANRDKEEYALVEFTVGKEVGVGAWGENSSSVLSAGVRYAEFTADSDIELRSDPDRYFPPDELFFKYHRHWHHYDVDVDIERSFKGFGPYASWEAAAPLLGGEKTGRVDVDWSLSGGVLFGKQKADVLANTTGEYTNGSILDEALYEMDVIQPIAETIQYRRKESVTVPNVGATLGLSYALDRIKFSAGYRWERYFDVIDSGIADAKKFDRTIDGPYVKVALGFGE